MEIICAVISKFRNWYEDQYDLVNNQIWKRLSVFCYCNKTPEASLLFKEKGFILAHDSWVARSKGLMWWRSHRVFCFGGISPKFHIESVVPNAAMFKGVTLGKCLAHEGSELISGLIQWDSQLDGTIGN